MGYACVTLYEKIITIYATVYFAQQRNSFTHVQGDNAPSMRSVRVTQSISLFITTNKSETVQRFLKAANHRMDMVLITLLDLQQEARQPS